MNSSLVDLSRYNFNDEVVANFVTTGLGTFQDDSGSSRGISNNVDRQVLIHLRSQASAVLVGGQTARVEDYKMDARFETIVITRKDLHITDGLTRLKAESDSDLSHVIESLKTSHNSLLIEAGPTLVARLAKLHLIDILCLTVVDPIFETTQLMKSLFDIDDADLLSAQEVENTLLTIWRLK